MSQIGEATVTMAQSTICEAMERANVRPSELARRLQVSRPYVSKLLNGGANLTVRQLARVLWALGFEVRFTLARRP